MARAAGGLACGLGFAAFLLATLSMDGSGRYPLAYSQLLIGAIAILFLASGFRDWRQARIAESRQTDAAAADGPGGTAPMLVTIALCIAYAASWSLLGFSLATLLYVAAQLWVLHRRHWIDLLTVPAGITLLVWLVFDKLLLLPLPIGTLFGG